LFKHLGPVIEHTLDLTNIQNAYTKAASDAAARTAIIISARSSLGNNLMYAVSCSVSIIAKKAAAMPIITRKFFSIIRTILAAL
jgi:hypothetical protein